MPEVEVEVEATPQLAYSARKMLEMHIAKYNDPCIPEWDWNDINGKWERHAFSAFMDLKTAEAKRDSLQQENEQLRKAARAIINMYGDAPIPHQVRELVTVLKERE